MEAGPHKRSLGRFLRRDARVWRSSPKSPRWLVPVVLGPDTNGGQHRSSILSSHGPPWGRDDKLKLGLCAQCSTTFDAERLRERERGREARQWPQRARGNNGERALI